MILILKSERPGVLLSETCTGLSQILGHILVGVSFKYEVTGGGEDQELCWVAVENINFMAIVSSLARFPKQRNNCKSPNLSEKPCCQCYEKTKLNTILD